MCGPNTFPHPTRGTSRRFCTKCCLLLESESASLCLSAPRSLTRGRSSLVSSLFPVFVSTCCQSPSCFCCCHTLTFDCDIVTDVTAVAVGHTWHHCLLPSPSSKNYISSPAPTLLNLTPNSVESKPQSYCIWTPTPTPNQVNPQILIPKP